MQYEDAIARVRKLLKLASHANTSPEEAATAAAQAQKLMDRYKIERLSAEADVVPEDETLFHTQSTKADGSMGTPLDRLGKKVPTWKSNLAHAVCKANQVEMYRGYREISAGRYERTIEMIGRKNDMLTAAYIYQYLVREIDRLAAVGKGRGRTWLNNFHLGATHAVRDRLYAEKKAIEVELRKEAEKKDAAASAAEVTALVRVDNALAVVESRYKRAVEYGKQTVGIKPGKRANVRFEADAYTQGRRAGESIRLTRAKGGLPSGGRR